MRALDVGELVRHDRNDLVLREPAVEQRVVQRDPAGRAEPGDERVGRRGSSARVGDVDLVHVDADLLAERLDSCGERPVGERLEAVEQRLDHDGLQEDVGHPQHGEPGCAGDPPAPAEAGGQQQRAGDRDGHEHGEHGQGNRLVSEPGAVALLREPVAALPPVADGGERKRGKPDGADRGQPEQKPDAHPAVDAPLQPPGQRAPLPGEHAEHRELDQGGRDPEPARKPPVRLDAIELGVREERAGVDRRPVELRHLRAQQEVGGDRNARRRRYAEDNEQPRAVT